MPNAEIVDRIDSSDEWIKTRSGITSRRWADDDETIVSMSVAASRDALAAAGLEADQIDAVVLATSSLMVLGPSAGAVVATELVWRTPLPTTYRPDVRGSAMRSVTPRPSFVPVRPEMCWS